MVLFLKETWEKWLINIKGFTHRSGFILGFNYSMWCSTIQNGVFNIVAIKTTFPFIKLCWRVRLASQYKNEIFSCRDLTFNLCYEKILRYIKINKRLLLCKLIYLNETLHIFKYTTSKDKLIPSKHKSQPLPYRNMGISRKFVYINKRPMGHIAHLRKQFKSIIS